MSNIVLFISIIIFVVLLRLYAYKQDIDGYIPEDEEDVAQSIMQEFTYPDSWGISPSNLYHKEKPIVINRDSYYVANTNIRIPKKKVEQLEHLVLASSRVKIKEEILK